MLRAALAFIVLASIALILGATHVGSAFTLDLGRVVLIAFVLLALVGVGLGILGGGHAGDRL